MRGVNKTTHIGRLGGDPETRYTSTGKTLAEFSLAVTQFNGDTLWLKVTCWGKTAEFASEYLKKGDLVYVDGRLDESSWEDKEGNRRSRMFITANEVNVLSSKRDKKEDLGI
jgi:single-strand DNA-binding protein